MVKVYLKLFLMGAAVYFLAMLPANLAAMGAKLALIDAAVKGSLFGLAVSAAMGTVHMMRVRKKAGENASGDVYSAAQERELKVRLPFDRVFSLLQHYLKEVSGFSVTRADQDAGRLEARTGFTFASTLGNRITVTLRKEGEGETGVKITAKPLLFTIVADYGENLEIAGGIAAYLRDSEHR